MYYAKVQDYICGGYCFSTDGDLKIVEQKIFDYVLERSRCSREDVVIREREANTVVDSFLSTGEYAIYDKKLNHPMYRPLYYVSIEKDKWDQ